MFRRNIQIYNSFINSIMILFDHYVILYDICDVWVIYFIYCMITKGIELLIQNDNNSITFYTLIVNHAIFISKLIII